MRTHSFTLLHLPRIATVGFLAVGFCASLTIAQEGSRSAERAKSVVVIEGDNVRPAERAFLEQAWTLLRQQRQLGNLAVGSASSSDVRTHAQQIAGDLRRLSEGLEGLMRKKGIALFAGEETPTEAYQLVTERSGAAFDRSFVQALGELHVTMGALFESAAAEIKDTDIREFAAAQLPMLRGHRNRIIRVRTAIE